MYYNNGFLRSQLSQNDYWNLVRVWAVWKGTISCRFGAVSRSPSTKSRGIFSNLYMTYGVVSKEM